MQGQFAADPKYNMFKMLIRVLFQGTYKLSMFGYRSEMHMSPATCRDANLKDNFKGILKHDL